ncbi:hypothetical protein [Agaribacter flavus]|uniref:TM2 domain-containing protein n=1 Tax=Agaribacter flavus TaxID=1902781 RepID=A0ABV7FM87_9ALTE
MSDGPNYTNYSHLELLEAYESIDRENYPERFQKICKFMQEKGLIVETETGFQLTTKAYESSNMDRPNEESKPSYTCLPPEPQYDDEGNYIPNEIPKKNRVTNALFSVGIILYGGYGLHVNELWVPLAKRISIVLTGIPAILMFVAIVFASIMMIAEVVDHYDKRDNEHTYYKVALYFKNLAYAVFGIAVVLGLFMGSRIG